MHKHKWLCTDIPGIYSCTCGGGYWNSMTQSINVYEDN